MKVNIFKGNDLCFSCFASNTEEGLMNQVKTTVQFFKSHAFFSVRYRMLTCGFTSADNEEIRVQACFELQTKNWINT